MSTAMKWTVIGGAFMIAAGVARYFGQDDVAMALFGLGAGALGKEHGRSSRELEPEPELNRAQRRDS